MTYVFTLDASACTGCKACQAACKDKNNLPVGVLWRRVVEVSGGDWIKSGSAWVNNVFSYNLSMACNHCVHPKCAGVCPTNAYHVREDGIVILDSSKCMGCGYCNWACPYAVPQYNQASGVMSKCNFCFDEIEAGGAPACVAACPLRVLDFEELEETELEKPGLALWKTSGAEHPFPLPVYSRTQPHLRLTPHPAMLNDLEKTLANREEIKPAHAKSELPLVVFTLLIQMAVGVFWSSQWLFLPSWGPAQTRSTWLRLLPTVLVILMLALGMLISFAHLGSKQTAWRAFGNLKKSWLSREILFLGLFGASCLLSLFPWPVVHFLAVVLGFGLIYSMANVYRLRSMAVWNSWRTLAGFLLAATLLGINFLSPVLQAEAQFQGFWLAPVYPLVVNAISILLLLGELILAFEGKQPGNVTRLRTGLILVSIFCLASVLIFNSLAGVGTSVIILSLILAEELLGRWLFYAELDRRIL